MKILHSHNDYWNKYPFHTAINGGANMLEADIIFLGGCLMLSHSWRPFKWMCRGELEETYFVRARNYLWEVQDAHIWLYIEYKSGNKNINYVLRELFSKYKHPRLHYAISAMNTKWYHKSRFKQACDFMRLFRDEFNILWETEVEAQNEYERQDFYIKKWWMF